MPCLIAENLNVDFGEVRALAGLNLTANSGQITGLLGPNGAGKTTFIRSCIGLVTPTSGSITVLGAEPGSATAQAGIGLMPQATGAWSYITPRHLLPYLGSLYANPQPVGPLMRLLGIDQFERTMYRRLSGGQQQAVNLAGALIGRPRLIFLDEPTAGLDVRARRNVWSVVQDVRAAGTAVVLTTHDMTEAARLSDVVSIIDHGRITLSGSVPELTSDASLEDVFLAHTTGGGI